MGRPAEKPKPCPAGAPLWMVTFGDLMSLLLTFFVLLLSFSTMDVIKFKQVTGQVEQNFGVQKSVPVYESPIGINIIAQEYTVKLDEDIIKRLKATIKRYKKVDDPQAHMELFKDVRGIVLRISGNYIFDPASYLIKPTAWPLLDEIISTFKKVSQKVDIYIEAHTDSQPLNNKVIGTNWELSALRAVSIVRYFVEGSQINGEIVHGVGRGDSVPIFPNNSTINRMRNRRVEFIFSTSKRITAPKFKQK